MGEEEPAAFIEDHDDRSEEELRRFLQNKGYSEERIENTVADVKARVPLRAWLLTGVITVFLSFVPFFFSELVWLYINPFLLGATIITVYCSVFTYWLLGQGTKQPRRVAKRLLLPTMFLIVAAVAIYSLGSRFPWVYLIFASTSITVFFSLPIILTWLDARGTPGFNHHPLTCLLYVVLFNLGYYVYWFNVLKKHIEGGDEIASLWLFAIPVVGPIIIYYSTANHLGDHTSQSADMWFAVFFFLPGLNLPIAQYLLGRTE